MHVVAVQGSGEEGALVDLAVAAVEMLASVGNAAADGGKAAAANSGRCCSFTVPKVYVMALQRVLEARGLP